jgi:membrane associated rhomboid family serine protease
MLEDRDYMRQPEYHDSGWRPGFRPRWSWTVGLLVIYAVVFLAELAVGRFFPDQARIFGYLALSKEGLEHGFVWQLITYQFMHAGWLHLLMNGWVIFMFGREMESILGGRKFLALMLSSGILGGVFQVLAALVWPHYFGGPVVGASACAFGLVAAFAAMFPERELTLLLFFVIPVHLRARTLLIISGMVALVGFGWHFDKVAHAAHLGGMAMGWYFVRGILQGDWARLGGALRPAEKKLPPRLRPEPADEKPEGSFMESEVDPILDKISAHGIQSLTQREREILEAARKRVGRP